MLYVSTRRGSRKARNIAEHILSPDDPDLVRLVNAGCLKTISSHGELDLPDGSFLRITPARTLHTYGLGLPLRRLIRDPLNAGGCVELG